ncbi:MAG: dTMP kinase, partial [Pseudomonadota bacterium]
MVRKPAGCFITFEGGDGTGKSTQVARLATSLGAVLPSCWEVVVTREPGGAPFAEEIRALLLQPGARNRTPRAEALLFAAARADHVAVTIGPALARGAFVLCDRYVDSTR